MSPESTKLEAETREEIDQKLIAAGWVIQDKKQLNLYESLGVAVREMDTDTGAADYMLFVGGKACGIIEAKREGKNLGGVAEQSQRYATSTLKHIQRAAANDEPLPFLYEATNHEIRFRDERDPGPRSRYVFHFHKPETLKKWLQEGSSFRKRLLDLPELNTEGLRDCQIDAIHGIEKSLKQAKPRALLQMATGSGKTFTAVTEVYRLAKFSKAKRVLFLVDRGNLGRQALKEYQQYTVPEDGRKFTELYNAHILGTAGIGDEIKVTISTIQRMYSQLSGKELDEEAEEHSGYEVENFTASQKARKVTYNPAIPIETFDVIIIDECHRSIYNLWRQVLEYFDAFLIGLTATPTKKTIGFFNQNLVSEYTHEDAVIDKVNVGYDIYSIITEKTKAGGLIEAGTTVQIRDKLTKEKRLEMLDQAEDYTGRQLDRSVIAPNQIRTIIQTFKERVFKDIFPERSGDWLPKTLIFAKDDDHADRVVDAVREEFGEGNDFCKKITYKVGKKTAEDTIAEFRINPRLRVGVTVDMIATGTDIKPLEIVMFMRDVKSPSYYEQMKGRGTRVIGEDELRKVTPDARGKTRFVLIDCVGVTETDKTESRSLESKPGIATAKLMAQVARGDRHSDTLRSLGNRMIRLDLKLTDQQRKHLNNFISSLNLPLPLGEGWGEGTFEVNEPVPEYLIENARDLRKNQTDAEALLWQLLRNRQIQDCKFRRQHPVEPYILDFYCHDKKLAIELDGGQHNTDDGKESDEKRTEYLNSKGIHVLRFWNNDVLQNTESVLEEIYNALTPTLSQREREPLPQTSLINIASNLIHATNEEKLVKAAQTKTGKEEVTEEQIQQTFEPEADELIKPFHNPALRELLETLRKDTEQIIDESPDELIDGGAAYTKEKAEGLINNWQQFIKDHQNELDAIQLIYQQPYQKRHLSYDMINQLVEEIEQPPYHIAPAEVWKAYEQLEKAKVKGAPPESKLPILISLLRLATGVTDVLEPFTELVNDRFDNWIKQQSTDFKPDQLDWLNKIKEQIAQNAEMTVDDFEYTPFNQEGGLLKARELFGTDLQPIIDELNGYLIA
jgi:type I restriction enzyme R subunit